MKLFITAAFSFSLAIISYACLSGEEKKESPEEQVSAVAESLNAEPPNDSSVVLSAIMPKGINAKPPFSLESLQDDFDEFSWQSFIALNWPANADGTPNTNLTIGEQQAGANVWQLWKSSREVFLPNGAKPNAWGEVENVPKVCRNLSEEELKKGIIQLTQVGKTPNVLDESGEPFQTGPLIDQNGQYTRYEILVNEIMFDYIVDNKLYNHEGQEAFNQDANFPGSVPNTDTMGAIMVKAAWVKMGGKYDKSKFHTTYALVYNNPEEQEGVEEACELVEVGLVGFHIGHKTKSDPQWIWSTFEHVDNVPTKGEARNKDFYNYYSADSDYPVNEPPARPWDPATKYTTPSQIERVIPITKEAQAINKKWQDALRAAVPNNVWANYELVSTQWPTKPESVTDPAGAPAPPFLSNTTLESYIQGKIKQTSSSCINCHNNASMTNGKFSDFTYLLQRAQKEKN